MNQVEERGVFGATGSVATEGPFLYLGPRGQAQRKVRGPIETRHVLSMLIFLLIAVGVGDVSRADPVATGSFSLTSYTANPYPLPFDVSLAFSNTSGPNGDGSFSAFGYDFNLPVAVGSIFGTGSTTETTGSPESGGFSATYLSPNLGFVTSGSFICDIQGCTSGLPISFVGTMSDIVATPLAGNLPNDPNIVYTVDGSAVCSPGAPGHDVCNGTFSINAFLQVATPVGSDVTVPIETSFINPENQELIPVSITVKYDTVSCPGETVVTTVSNAAGNLSSSFATGVGDFLAAFFDISTTACISGPITICSSYPDIDNDGIVDGTEGATTPVSECQMRVLHDEGGTFVDKTLAATDPDCPPIPGGAVCQGSKKSQAPCIDPTSNLVCARVDSLSAFVTAVEAAQLDHFLCYKVRDKKQPPFEKLDVSLQDQFSSQTAPVRRLDSVCAPVDKNGEGINDPNSHLCCYKVKTARLEPKPVIEVTSQFQSSQVEVKKSRLLCAPCVNNGLP